MPPGEALVPLTNADPSYDGFVAPTFDYAALEISVADEMRQAAERVCSLMRSSVIDVGRELIAAKGRVERGQFVKWVEAECQLNIRTAQRMMQAAEIVEKNDKLSLLNPSSLYMLAAPSTPASSLEQVRQELDAGKVPSYRAVRGIIGNDRYRLKTERRAAASAKKRKLSRARRELIERSEQMRRKREAKQDAAAEKAIALIMEKLTAEEVTRLTRLLDTAQYHFSPERLAAASEAREPTA
jgi:DUF3102 family protein